MSVSQTKIYRRNEGFRLPMTDRSQYPPDSPSEQLLNPLLYIPSFFKVLSKADASGQSFLIPMNLLPAQEYYIKSRTHRDIILKPRQVGISTGVLAANFHYLLTNPYTKMAVIAHKADAATFLLQTIHRFYNNLPEELKPKIDWKSSSRLRFPKLDAFIHIDSAESKTVGRSETLNIAHLSEVAQWYEPNAVELFAGISQTIPIGGFTTLESTPNGRGGFFYRMYDGAKRGDIPYKVFFFPWWFESSFTLPLDPNKQGLTFSREEEILMSNAKLTPEQINWRRLKLTELGDLFYQEYPENDIDCFMSSDVSAFDGVALRRYLLDASPGVLQGNTRYWKRTVGGRKYIIGVDVGGGLPKGDFSVACVLDTKNNEHCATLRARISPDLFAEELVRLAREFNYALVAVERIQHGHTVIRVLQEHNYPFLYHEKDYSNPLQIVTQPGWVTSGRTRPTMIDNFNASIRSGDLITKSENLLKEAASFQYIGQKYQAPSGEFDDELFAMMIALMVRETAPVSGLPRPRPFQYAKI